MRRRSGFTLTELLVVITIILILSTLAFAVFGTGKSSDKMRSGARTTQSAFLGGKDRAMHAKDLRGVRLTHDLPDGNLVDAYNFVNGFVYVQPLPMQSAGNLSSSPNSNDFSITRPGLTATPPYTDATQITVLLQTLVNGKMVPTEWQSLLAQDSNNIWPSTTVQVRIPSSNSSVGAGQWYQLQKQSNTYPYWWVQDPNNSNQAFLYLQTNYAGGNGNPPPNPAVTFLDANASCDILLGNDVLPFHEPITLPAGCVIDLVWSQIPGSQSTSAPVAGLWYSWQSVLPNNVPAGWVTCGNDPNTAGNVIARTYSPQMDVMFSPRGNVSGTLSALGALYFVLRDIRDATLGFNPAQLSVNPQGDALVLAVFPQSGLVQTYDLNLTDVNGDGFADDIFAFAKRGMSAGK